MSSSDNTYDIQQRRIACSVDITSPSSGNLSATYSEVYGSFTMQEHAMSAFIVLPVDVPGDIITKITLKTNYGTEAEIQTWWTELMEMLNRGTVQQKLQSVYKLKLLGSRKADVCAFINDDTNPRTALSITFVGDLKSHRATSNFSPSNLGQVIDYAVRTSVYQPSREDVIGFVADDTIIQFIVFHCSNKTVSLFPCLSLEEGIRYLLAMLHSSPTDIGYPHEFQNIRQLVGDVKFLGSGANCSVFSGIWQGAPVVFKIYNRTFARTQEKNALMRIANTRLFEDVPHVVAECGVHVLIVSPPCISFAYRPPDFDFGSVQKPLMKACHYVHLVNLLHTAHDAGILHMDVAPWNFFLHPKDSSKVLLNDWGSYVTINTSVSYPGNKLLAPVRVLANRASTSCSANLPLTPADDLEVLVHCIYMVHMRQFREVISLAKEQDPLTAAIQFWNTHLLGFWSEMVKASASISYAKLIQLIETNIPGMQIAFAVTGGNT